MVTPRSVIGWERAGRTFSYSADGQLSGVVHDAAGRISEWDKWRFLEYDPEGV